VNKLSFFPLLVSIVTGTVIGLSGCSGGDEATVTANGNTAPIADAGVDKNVVTGVVVQLDGSGSSDADGDALSYQWALQSKPTSSSSFLSTTTEVNPSFEPNVDGEYIISLVVNDGTVDSTADTVTFTASLTANNPPVANAGADKNVVTGVVVQLDGSGSSDLDGDTFTYQWTLQSQPTNSLSTLFSSTLVNPTFTPDLDGSYSISLVVNDGIVDSSIDTVVVTASATPPLVGTFAGGQAIYDKDCGRCHAAGSHDTSTKSGASDLYLKGYKIIIKIGTLNGMSGFSDLTEQEVADLKVFLDSPLIAP
jgi:mono/diheme cytochrome c family protein